MSEWDSSSELRELLRGGKPLIQEVSEKASDIQLPAQYDFLIKPILLRMAQTPKKKMPDINAIRHEIKNILDASKRDTTDEAMIDRYAWLLRKQLTFVKAKCRRKEVSNVSRSHKYSGLHC